jgi:hypothetical protein
LTLYVWLHSPLLGLVRSFSFLIFTQSIRLLGRGISQPVARTLLAKRTAQTQKNSQTAMPQVGFEPKIPLFEHVKTVLALDIAATVIGVLACHVVLTLCNGQHKQWNHSAELAMCCGLQIHRGTASWKEYARSLTCSQALQLHCICDQILLCHFSIHCI